MNKNLNNLVILFLNTQNMKILVGILVIILLLGLVFLIASGIVYLICLSFGIEFQWGYPIGIWLIILLIKFLK